MTQNQTLRQLSPAVVIIGILFIVMPLAATLMQVWPLHPGAPQWRFGAYGLYANNLLLPAFGLLLLSVWGILLQYRGIVWAALAVAGVFTLILLGASVAFVLDSVQLRAAVNPQAQSAMVRASATALVQTLVALLAMLATAIAGWRAVRSTRPQGEGSTSKRASTPSILAGQRTGP